jgi:hypothetical protein
MAAAGLWRGPAHAAVVETRRTDSAAERGVWSRAWSVTTCLPPCADRAQGDEMTQPAPEPAEDREAWRDLQDVLEERDREWWADASSDLDD